MSARAALVTDGVLLDLHAPQTIQTWLLQDGAQPVAQPQWSGPVSRLVALRPVDLVGVDGDGPHRLAVRLAQQRWVQVYLPPAQVLRPDSDPAAEVRVALVVVLAQNTVRPPNGPTLPARLSRLVDDAVLSLEEARQARAQVQQRPQVSPQTLGALWAARHPQQVPVFERWLRHISLRLGRPLPVTDSVLDTVLKGAEVARKQPALCPQDPRALLSLPEDWAGQPLQQLRPHWRAAVRLAHPDRNRSHNATAQFQAISEAWDLVRYQHHQRATVAALPVGCVQAEANALGLPQAPWQPLRPLEVGAQAVA